MMLALFFAAMTALVDWPVQIAAAEKAVPRLEMKIGQHTGVCSAVVFEIVDGKASALTAAHCVEHQPTDQFDLTVNDKHAEVQVTNRILDLAIITFRARGESTILLATAAPAKGAEVAILGYAFGVEEIVAQFGRVAQPYNKETKALWINADLIFGDSGGALIDADGRLVGINSRIFTGGPFGQMAHIGGAVPLNAIEDFIDHYRKTKKDRK